MEQINELIKTRDKIQELYKELEEAQKIEDIKSKNQNLNLKLYSTTFEHNKKMYKMKFLKPKNQNFTIFQRNYIIQTQFLNKNKSQLTPEQQQINQHNLNEITKIFIIKIYCFE